MSYSNPLKPLFISAFLVLLTSGISAEGSVKPGFYTIIFGYEARPGTVRTPLFGARRLLELARYTHTYATFIQVRPGGSYVEKTISWIPDNQRTSWRGGRIPEGRMTGKNYNLDQSLKLARGKKRQHFGPYKITEDLFRKAEQRISFLNSGSTDYKMVVLRRRLRLPTLNNRGGGAINCIMAVSDLMGFLDTNTLYGPAASHAVVEFFVARRGIVNRQIHSDVAELIHLNQRL